MENQPQTYAVSRIISHRLKTTQSGNSYEYLVRWKDENNDKDMAKEDDTWEPTTSFVEGEQSSAIQEYWQNHKIRTQNQNAQNVIQAPQQTIIQTPMSGHQIVLNQPSGQFSQQVVHNQQLLVPMQGQQMSVVQGQQIVQGQQVLKPNQQFVLVQSPTGVNRPFIQQAPLNINTINQHGQPIMVALASPPASMSPLTSPVPQTVTITQSPRTASVIQPNAFPVIKSSPTRQGYASPVRHSSPPAATLIVTQQNKQRRISESSGLGSTVKNELIDDSQSQAVSHPVKSPSSGGHNLGALELLAEAADKFTDVKTETDQPRDTNFVADSGLEDQLIIKPERADPSPSYLNNSPSKDNAPKKKRGRPAGLTKKKIEERKKAKELEEKTKGSKPIAPKKRRGRPPKAAAETKELVQKAQERMADSDSDSTSSSNDTTSSADSSSDEEIAQPKIKKAGEPLSKLTSKSNDHKLKKKETPPKIAPPHKLPDTVKKRKNSIPKAAEVSPEKNFEKRRDSSSSIKHRRESVSSNLSNSFEPMEIEKNRKNSLKTNAITKPKKEVKSIEDLSWAVETVKNKSKFINLMKPTEMPQPIGFNPGQLVTEVSNCVSSDGDINALARKLVGVCRPHEEKIIIPDELNGINRDSALVKAASADLNHGGPAIINALCGIGGADPNQRHVMKDNTPLHVAAQARIAGNVSALIGYKSQINWRNEDNKSALHLAVEEAIKWEKFASSTPEQFQGHYDNAYSCVELLLAAGADIYPEIMQIATLPGTQFEIADILQLYDHITKAEVYKFIKRSMGKQSLSVHEKLLATVNVVPSDQNLIEIVVPKLENFHSKMFLMLFAVHGEHEGFGADFNLQQKKLRLSGSRNCLVTDVIWHRPRIKEDSKGDFEVTLDGLPTMGHKGQFEPGKPVESYGIERVDDSHYVTPLHYIPYQENKYSIGIIPAHWTNEKLFLRVYACELSITEAALEKKNPQLLRYLNDTHQQFEQNEKMIRRSRQQWTKEMGKKCEILREGHPCPKVETSKKV